MIDEQIKPVIRGALVAYLKSIIIPETVRTRITNELQNANLEVPSESELETIITDFIGISLEDLSKYQSGIRA